MQQEIKTQYVPIDTLGHPVIPGEEINYKGRMHTYVSATRTTIITEGGLELPAEDYGLRNICVVDNDE